MTPHEADDVFQHGRRQAHELHETARGLSQKRRSTHVRIEKALERHKLVGIEEMGLGAAHRQREALKALQPHSHTSRL